MDFGKESSFDRHNKVRANRQEELLMDKVARLLASDACLRRMVLVSLEVQRVAWVPARLRTFAGEVIRCDALSDRFHVQEGRTRRLQRCLSKLCSTHRADPRCW